MGVKISDREDKLRGVVMESDGLIDFLKMMVCKVSLGGVFKI